jgi:hypothetical protein
MSNGQGNSGLPDAARADDRDQPLFPEAGTNLMDDLVTTYHPAGRNRKARTSGKRARLVAFSFLTNDRSDKGIPTPLHICDVFETELSVAQGLAQRRQMDAQTAFLNGHVRPRPGNQRVLADNLAGLVDERHENVERPGPERNHFVRLFESALGDVQLERTEQ